MLRRCGAILPPVNDLLQLRAVFVSPHGIDRLMTCCSFARTHHDPRRERLFADGNFTSITRTRSFSNTPAAAFRTLATSGPVPSW